MGIVESLNQIDHSMFFFLNGLHCSFLDPLIYWGTQSLVWIPLYLLLLFIVIRNFKWRTLWILLFAALMILVSDQLSNLFKEWISRPRPTHEPGLPGIHTVHGYTGGEHGFYSAHASNTMALAIFLIFLLKDRYKILTLLLFLWALFMGYTRIYLGVHFPGDIVAGFIIGGLIGYGTFRLFNYSVKLKKS